MVNMNTYHNSRQKYRQKAQNLIFLHLCSTILKFVLLADTWQGCQSKPLKSLLALYPGGIPRREPPSCEAPRQPTIYVTESPCEILLC